jgi:hypothetical protein
MLAPPAGSLPPLRWAWGPLSVPCRPGIPAYKLQVNTKSGACIHVACGTGPSLPANVGFEAAMCSVAPDPASLLGRAPVLPHASSSGPHLPTREGSGSATCPVALGLTFLLRRAPMPLCVLWLWVLPPWWEGSGTVARHAVPVSRGPQT